MKTDLSESKKSVRSLLFFSALLMVVLISVWARAEQVTLAWEANTETDLAGYKVHYGTASGGYTTTVDVRNVTTYIVTGLTAGQTYYFAASAYDISGSESGYSNEVSRSIPAATAAPSSPAPPSEDSGNRGALPEDSDPWRDSHGDGIGDNAEPKANPNGISETLEPNTPPHAPVAIDPGANEIVGLTPMLRTAPFHDPDARDFHASSRWQIVQSADGLVVMDVTSARDLTSFKVPRLILDENTVYQWRVIFTDSRGASSPWSQTGSFVTDFDLADSDGNGIPDDQEMDGAIDLNADGQPDADQPEMKSIGMPALSSKIGIQAGGSGKGVLITSLQSANEDVIDLDVDLDGTSDEMPFGIIHFKLIVESPGDAAEVTVYFSGPAPANARWYKYDPLQRKWSDFSAQAVFSADRTSMILTLQDGGEEDADGVANGVIVDPAGVVVASSFGGDSSVSSVAGGLPSASGSGSGGCFIQTAACETGRNLILMSLLSLVSLGALWRIRA
jgi:hypothetical protein